MSNQQNIIGRNLTTLRKNAGLTQKELAAKIGVNHSVISNWERGINKYDIEKLKPISEILEVSVNDLLGLDTEYLNSDEKKLIKTFRELDKQGKDLVLYVMEYEERRINERYGR